MYKVGMFGGSFNPLHLGHINNIIEASSMCEKLYIVLTYNDSEVVPYQERFMWLKQLAKDMPNIEVIAIKDESISKGTYNWEQGRNDIMNNINQNIDILFAGSDYQNKNIFESLYKDSIIHYFDRNIINISSTEIRNNPYQYFDYLPKVVRPYYTKKVVIVGTESCGKSTLVKNLAKAYNTSCVEEIGRDISEEAGGIDNMQAKHFVEILYRHKVNELDKIKEAYKVLFIDTDSTITRYYYDLLIKEANAYFHKLEYMINKLNEYDLYIFLEPDVKWVQDGTRTYGENQVRLDNNNMLKELFKERNINYEIVTGDYQERFVKTKKLVDNLLK
jgi:HTH-type transcriptional repressor of NAD biosynthesis genes